MNTINVDGLEFHFPAGWQASKYDEWSFYNNQFKKFSGVKAVDLLALSPEKNAFLIEVKDYRRPETARPSELPLVLASKVHDTLAALLPARLHANELNERNLAASILKCKALQVVFHIEQRPNQQVVDLADLQQKTRRLLRAIDTKPKFVSMKAMQNLGWTVSQPGQGHNEF